MLNSQRSIGRLWLVPALMFGLSGDLVALQQAPPGQEEEKAAQHPEAIESEPATPGEDAQIRSRIEEIFSQIEGLQSVNVEVDNGVVVLSGEVESQESREQAEKLADRVSGTILVVNSLSRDHSLYSRLASTSENIRDKLHGVFALAPLLLLSLGIVAASMLLARVAGKSDWLFERLSHNWFVRDLIRQLLQVAIVVSGVIIALQLLDATALLGSVVGALGILGLAIGFATRETVENYIASVLLSLKQPFRRDDLVSVDDIEGIVMRLTPRATVLMQPDGNHLRIPNAKVFKAVIINFTRNPLRRFEFTVGVDTDLDLNDPRRLAVRVLKGVPGVLDSPEPMCLVDALGDSSVILKVLAWIDQRESDFQKARSEAQQAVKDAFDEAGIVMPEPIYNVNLRRLKPGAKRFIAQDPATTPSPAHEEPGKGRENGVGDTSPDTSVDQQIMAERQASSEEDLLDAQGPSE